MSPLSNRTDPIALFDSGIGGLNVLNAVRQILPNEPLLYLADSQYAPYGDKSLGFIQQRAHQVVSYLESQGAKAIVVACNTATAAAVESLRDQFKIPIVGVEPGIKPAATGTASGRIGVLATDYTVNSKRFRNLIDRVGGETEVIVQGAPGLVELIESSEFDPGVVADLLKRFLDPMIARGIDQLVLGCTHYAFLSEQILQTLPAGVELVDTPNAVAQQLERRLEGAGLLISPSTPTQSEPRIRCLTTSDNLEQARALFKPIYRSVRRINHSAITRKTGVKLDGFFL